MRAQMARGFVSGISQIFLSSVSTNFIYEMSHKMNLVCTT